MNKIPIQLANVLNTSSELRTEEDINVLLQLLAEISDLDGRNKKELRTCAQNLKFKTFQKNDMIYRRHDNISSWYYIFYGSVLVGFEMFLPNKSFGIREGSIKERQSDCIVLEDTGVIEFPYATCFHNEYPCSCLLNLDSDNNRTQRHKKSQPGSDTSSGYSGSDRISNGDNESVSWQIGQDTVSRQSDGSSSHKTEKMGFDSESDDDNFSDFTFNEISCQDHIKEILQKPSAERNNQETETIMNIVHNVPLFSLWPQSLRLTACKLARLKVVEKAQTVLIRKGDRIMDWGYVLQGTLEVRRSIDDKDKDSVKQLGEVLETLRYSDSFGADLRKGEEEISSLYVVTASDDCWLMLISFSEFLAAKTLEPTTLSQVVENEKTVVVMELRTASDECTQGKVLIKATVKKLIEYLFENHSPVEENFIEDFFLTYNIYMDSTVLVRNVIIEQIRKQSHRRKKCTEIVVKWISSHFRDMENQTEILKFIDLIVLILFRENEEDCAGQIYQACSANSTTRTITIISNDKDVKMKPIIIGNGSKLTKDIVPMLIDEYPVEYSRCSLFRDGQSLSGLYISQSPDIQELRAGDKILKINNTSEENLSQKTARSLVAKSQLCTLMVKYDPEGFYRPFLANFHKKSIKSKISRSISIHSGLMEFNTNGSSIEPGYSTLPLKPTLINPSKNSGIIKKMLPTSTTQTVSSSALKKMMKRCKANNSFSDEKKVRNNTKSRSAHCSPNRYQGSTPSLVFDNCSEECISKPNTMSSSLIFSSNSSLKPEQCVKLRKMKGRSDSQPDLVGMAKRNLNETQNRSHDFIMKVYYKDSNDNSISGKPTVRSVYLIVNREMEAIEIIVKSINELNLSCNSSSEFVLVEVSVEAGNTVKHKIIKENTADLFSMIRLNNRFYLKRKEFTGQFLEPNDIQEIESEMNKSFLDLSITELATQIYIESYNTFKSINSAEIMDFVTNKTRREYPVKPTIQDVKPRSVSAGAVKETCNTNTESLNRFQEYLKLSEKYMYFVVNVICCEHQSINKRSKILKRLIRLTRICKELGNVEIFFSLMNGLDRVEISRLRQTWDRIPHKELKMFRQMQQLLDVSGNMRLLRSLHKSCHPPVIPMAALVTKDLTTINEVHSTKVEADSISQDPNSQNDYLINFDKLRIMSKLIRQFKNSIYNCNKHEIFHKPTCALLPDDETAQAEAIKALILKADRNDSANSLSGSHTNINKRKSANINLKKIYENHMCALRIKNYLNRLNKIERDDGMLLSWSYKCEPRSDATAMTPNVSRTTLTNVIPPSPCPNEKDDSAFSRYSTTGSVSSKESSLTNFSSGSEKYIEPAQFSNLKPIISKGDRSMNSTPVSGQIQYLEPSGMPRRMAPPPPYSSLGSNPPIPPRRRSSVTSSEKINHDKSRSHSNPLSQEEAATHL